MHLSTVSENQGVTFHTEVLTSHNLRVLARIALVLQRDYLNKADWSCYLPKSEGSLTLRSGNTVIKLFVDPDQKLKTRLLHPPSAMLSNFVLGVELTHLDPFQREALRDYLKRCFGSGYADPREATGVAKVWLQPIQNHIYDLAWFTEGTCEEEVSEQEIEEFINGLSRKAEE